MLDAPSLVVVERILADLRRQRADADELRRELGLPAAAPRRPGAAARARCELVASPAAGA